MNRDKNAIIGMVAPRVGYTDWNLKLLPLNRTNAGQQEPAPAGQFKFTKQFLTFQNVQTYSSQLVNIGVIYFGDEADFWSCHWVLLRKKEFKFKDPPFKRCVLGSIYDYVEVAAVAFIRLCLDAWDVLCNQTPSFLGGK